MKGLNPELLEGWEGKGGLDLRRDVCIAMVIGLRHLWAWLVPFVLQSLEHPDKQPLCSMLLWVPAGTGTATMGFRSSGPSCPTP